MTQIDLASELAAQKSPGVLECVERLTGLVTIADDGDEHFAVAQIVANLDARHRYERQSWVGKLLRDERCEDSLDLVIDFCHSLSRP